MTFGRFLDNWVVDRVMFEYVNQGGCNCCGFVHGGMEMDDFMALCSDVNSDDGKKEKLSPWPKFMHDEIWTDRVKFRRILKKRQSEYCQRFSFSKTALKTSEQLQSGTPTQKENEQENKKECPDAVKDVTECLDAVKIEASGEDQEVHSKPVCASSHAPENQIGPLSEADEFFQWWNTKAEEVTKRRCFILPREQLSDTLRDEFDFKQAYNTLLCSIIEQVQNFPMTQYAPDGESDFEVYFEGKLGFFRGAFVVKKDMYKSEEGNKMFCKYLNHLISTSNLPKKPQPTNHPEAQKKDEKEEEGEGEDEDEGTDKKVIQGDDEYTIAGAEEENDQGEPKKDGQSFRSDRRLIRLVIFRYYADQAWRKFQHFKEDQKKMESK